MAELGLDLASHKTEWEREKVQRPPGERCEHAGTMIPECKADRASRGATIALQRYSTAFGLIEVFSTLSIEAVGPSASAVPPTAARTSTQGRLSRWARS
jgi:hypothetical protein